MLYVVQFFYPLREYLSIKITVLLNLSKLFGYFSFFNIHDLLVLGFKEELLPLLPLKSLLPIS